MTNDWIRPIPLPEQYSAELGRSDGGVIRVFMNGSKRRVEMRHPGGQVQITIGRPDLERIYSIDPDRLTYQEYPVPGEALENPEGPDDDEEWRLIGEEQLDGQALDLYESRLRGREQPHARVLVDPLSGIRVRTLTLNLAGEPVLTIETRNVKLGVPDDLHFQIPPGYTQE
jgi:hypothetical protein